MFVEPDWNAAIDFGTRLEAIPPADTIRGMFLQMLLQNMGADVAPSARGRRYLPFKGYPMREYVELLAMSCEKLQPGVAPAERVRRLGHGVYPGYAATITGTAIFAAAGRNMRRVLELCPAAFRIAVPDCEVSVRELVAGRGVLQIRRLWALPDLHIVGVVEGALQVCKAPGQVRVHKLGLADVDLEVTWASSAT